MEIHRLSPEKLTPYQNNAKKHSVKQIDKIAAQIAAVGWTQPIVVDKQLVIIAGHGRREAAIRLGLKEVPVVIMEGLDEYQVKAARIADNQVASEGEIDSDVLKFELGSLQLRDFNLQLTGFDLSALESLLDPKEAPPAQEVPKDNKEEPLPKDNNTGRVDQYLVVVECENEEEMKELFEEFTQRELKCKLIT